MKKILILGATSRIAECTARLFAERGDQLHLVGRNPEKLKKIQADLATRSRHPVTISVADLNLTANHRSLIDEATRLLGGQIDVALIAHGVLGVQPELQQSYEKTLPILEANFLSPVSLLTILANEFEKKGSGSLALMSTLAGDRGRQSNYIYGAAKGGINVFLQGLRNRLAKKGVQVLTLKIGFVDTPMTQSIPKSGPLWAQPETVARGIVRALDSGKDVSYLPWFWFWIREIIVHIPEFIFKKMSM